MLFVAALAVIAGSQSAPRTSPAGERARPQSEPSGSTAPRRLRWSEKSRTAALEEAAVWRPREAAAKRPRARRPQAFECRFKPDALGGTTRKFECTTDTGETVKVKYGGAEPHAEVAATHLMRAAGFGADDVDFVEQVRCYGCPAFPFFTMKVLGLVDAGPLYGRTVDYSRYRDFTWVAVERKHPGVEIETDRGRGWAWFELRRLKAPTAHVDALRLMAMFLAHWDNKAENQRLVCLESDKSALPRERCDEPLAIVQDLGATFGPRKVNLERWRHTKIWADRASCLVTMADMPHGGGTFPPASISEDGRRLLAEQLGALTRDDIRDLFEQARFPQRDGEDVEAWVAAFEEKVREIREGPPCPAA